MPKRKKKKTPEQIASEKFHATLVWLLRVPHDDWTPWEQDWLIDEAQRPRDYVYTEKELNILDQLVAYSKTVTEYNGYSVKELSQMAYSCRFDCDEDQQEFLEQLHTWNATDLKIRQARRLYGICRRFEPLPRAA
jgi:hypothetical protein